MNLKDELTCKVLEILNPTASEKDMRQAQGSWWFSCRKKPCGGLRLTDDGFDALALAGVKSYRIDLEGALDLNNHFVIQLDRLMDCPFYITNTSVYVFGEKMAVQLILFSGNLKKFISAKAERLAA
jgi:hypothetical protein